MTSEFSIWIAVFSNSSIGRSGTLPWAGEASFQRILPSWINFHLALFPPVGTNNNLFSPQSSHVILVMLFDEEDRHIFSRTISLLRGHMSLRAF
jgi:hypothetical protein